MHIKITIFTLQNNLTIIQNKYIIYNNSKLISNGGRPTAYIE